VFFPLPVKRLDTSIVITSSHLCYVFGKGRSLSPLVVVITWQAVICLISRFFPRDAQRACTGYFEYPFSYKPLFAHIYFIGIK
jgi:hypothetical protein